MNYFVFIRRNYHCFTDNVKFDVANANQIINNTVNNNSAHGYVSHLNDVLIISME